MSVETQGAINWVGVLLVFVLSILGVWVGLWAFVAAGVVGVSALISQIIVIQRILKS